MESLGEKALYYHNEGYNCSQCVLMAYADVYKKELSSEIINMCSAVNNGFGTGGICSVLSACVMLFGIVADDVTAKEMRVMLFDEFIEKYKNLNCMAVSGEGCENIILSACEITQRLINTA
jgi:hypothetical protein